MRLQVKVNVPLNIRMCLECPFYNCTQRNCSADFYMTDFREDFLDLWNDNGRTIPDKCPLLKLEEK